MLELTCRRDGRHYQRTCEDWLKLQDPCREQIMPILRESYGDGAELWFQRWRVFFMACAELFETSAMNGSSVTTC